MQLPILHMRIATLKLASGFVLCLFDHLITFSSRSFHLLMVLLYCRMEGGIPPLVQLLESQDLKVQRAAAGALRTLAFKNDENKTQVTYQNQ
jgi:hypothetical protein